jgi:hypothetical protein
MALKGMCECVIPMATPCRNRLRSGVVLLHKLSETRKNAAVRISEFSYERDFLARPSASSRPFIGSGDPQESQVDLLQLPHAQPSLRPPQLPLCLTSSALYCINHVGLGLKCMKKSCTALNSVGSKALHSRVQ